MVFVMNDIKNLITYFSNETSLGDKNNSVFEPALVPYESLEEWEDHAENWPEFLISILENRMEELQTKSKIELTKMLWTEYYHALNSCQDFLKGCMQNYIMMHDLLGLIRSKNLEVALWDHWIGFNSQLEDIRSGRLTLSGLAQEHENFNNLKIKTLESEPEEAEKWCDSLLIRVSEEKLKQLPFSIDHLIHYCYKIVLGSKWRAMNDEKGQARLSFLRDQLVNEIKIPSLK
jgi:hypothetical protein